MRSAETVLPIIRERGKRRLPLEDATTLSGCPQGGVIWPILSNIYLDKLDQ